MGRGKNKRILSFKPKFRSFVPEEKNYTEITTLLAEEIEAIYLMDVLNLYQEEASKRMEVSRPTFTRILKIARQKLTRALILGNKINIEDENLESILAICTSDINNFESILATNKYILIYKIKNNKISLIQTLENEVYTKKRKPAIILPQLFIENKVNIFVSSKIGEGLKNSLLAKGIQVIEKEIKDKKDFLEII
jgi:predicted DNA-binding protein (UPF0251 family)/predicted Fe-Mo cluster-binding NifX family protein